MAACPARGGDVAIRFDSVVKEFAGDWTGRRTRALDGVTFRVMKGTVTALVGPNGSGKSTLLKVAARLTQPSRGRCITAGRVGYLPETAAMPPLLRPCEVLEIFASSIELDAGEPERVLRVTGLAEHAETRVGTLSKGMRQRVALAVAMLGKPDILLLDEPTDGLDPRAVVQLGEILGAERAAGRTVLLTSHFLPAVERMADRVAVLERGRLLFAGERAEVARRGGVERIYLDTTLR
jgi:ABC-2 type transport system ATP-binding protein